MSWCQIVQGPNCPFFKLFVPNFPGAKFSGCQIVCFLLLVPNCLLLTLGAKLSYNPAASSSSWKGKSSRASTWNRVEKFEKWEEREKGFQSHGTPFKEFCNHFHHHYHCFIITHYRRQCSWRKKGGNYLFFEMLMLHISQKNFNKRREFLKQSIHILHIFLFCSLYYPVQNHVPT